MQPPHSIASLYIDFDAFFANVEKQIEPAIRARPVGITALDSDYSALITCCYMAKRAGITRGMRVGEARSSAPGQDGANAHKNELRTSHERVELTDMGRTDHLRAFGLVCWAGGPGQREH